ncbi:tetratricopeptide repeat protein [Catenuloplanes niger JCM 9533]
MSAVPGEPPRAETPMAEVTIRADGSREIYQSAGDQYIYEKGPTGPVVGSRGLPRDISTFVGRETEMHMVMSSVERVMDDGAVLPIVTISGMPGVGKSAFAVQAAHRLAGYFPDAQFFLDLRAHSAASDAGMEPHDALEALLMADGVESARIVGGLEARAAQWRSRLAGRRCLLILDNADREDQVQPLLPGDPRCLAIVTSRSRMTSMTAAHTTIALPLSTLPPTTAADLFGRISGRDPQGDEAEAIAELVNAAGRLPLAVCLLAAELRPEPGWRVSDLLSELRHASHAASVITAGGKALTPAFHLSYSRLPTPLRRVFRYLGAHPGAELNAAAVAALTDMPVARAGRHLSLLYENHLLDQPRRGRFRLHDLVGDYTRHLLSDETPAMRALLLGRISDHYLTLAVDAWRSITGDPSGAAGSEQARLRLEAERENLFACVDALVVRDDHQRVVGFAAGLAPILLHTGPWDRAIRLQRAAVVAAERLDDHTAVARALRELGVLYRLTGAYADAGRALDRALRIDRDQSDEVGMASTLARLGAVRRHEGNLVGAVEVLSTSVDISRRVGHEAGEAEALDELGVALAVSGDPARAVRCLQRALVIHRSARSGIAYADTLNQLGGVWQMMSDYPAAITAHEEALAVYQARHDAEGESRARHYLGGALVEIGDFGRADEVLRAAVPLLERLGNRRGHGIALNYLGVIARETGAYGTARQRLERALTIYRTLGYAHGEADAINHLGLLDGLTGDNAAASLAHQSALVAFARLGHLPGQAEALLALGGLELRLNRPEKAVEHYRAALRYATDGSCPGLRARAHEGLGRCGLTLGDPDPDLELRQAQRLYYRVGAVPAAEAITELLEQTLQRYDPPIAS